MDIRDRRTLKSNAAESLATAPCNPKKLIFLHAGIIAAFTLILSLLEFLLEGQIANTGGLSGLGTRTVLVTIQTVLDYASTVLLPFWNMGYIFAVLGMSRRESVKPTTLLEGFRRFGPVLRLFLLDNLIFIGLAMLCFYPSMMLFMITPLSQPFLAALEPLAADSALWDPTTLMDDAAIASALVPMLVLFACVYLVVAIPIFYRFRMANFALVDNPKAGAFAALRSSARMMRRNRWALFRLDLSFWWFYGLEALSAVLCYGDVILMKLGIILPISEDASYFLFYALGLAAQTLLYCWARNHVMVTYAKAYDALRQQPAPSAPAPTPKNQPWNY